MIPVNEETKCLRVVFDRMLAFVPNRKYLKALVILKVVGTTEWGADRKVMLQLTYL